MTREDGASSCARRPRAVPAGRKTYRSADPAYVHGLADRTYRFTLGTSGSGETIRRLAHAFAQTAGGGPTVRPVIVSGVIMMNRLRVPSAHGTGPSVHSEVNV